MKNKIINILKISQTISTDQHGEVTYYDNSNLYGCKFGDKVFVGPFIEIQNNVTIGDNSRIQSHTFICSNVTIGSNCFVGHGVMFVNDKFINDLPRGHPDKLMSTVIGNNVKIGSGSVILPVSICDNVVIGAGSVVTKDIDIAGIYCGNPSRRIK